MKNRRLSPGRGVSTSTWPRCATSMIGSVDMRCLSLAASALSYRIFAEGYYNPRACDARATRPIYQAA